jgi:hypothetical protein
VAACIQIFRRGTPHRIWRFMRFYWRWLIPTSRRNNSCCCCVSGTSIPTGSCRRVNGTFPTPTCRSTCGLGMARLQNRAAAIRSARSGFSGTRLPQTAAEFHLVGEYPLFVHRLACLLGASFRLLCVAKTSSDLSSWLSLFIREFWQRFQDERPGTCPRKTKHLSFPFFRRVFLITPDIL